MVPRVIFFIISFFFSSRRRHTRFDCDWSSDVCSSDLPNRTHAPLAREALEAGIAVVVDKPFAATAQEGRPLIEEARRRQLMLTVFQNRQIGRASCRERVESWGGGEVLRREEGRVGRGR